MTEKEQRYYQRIRQSFIGQTIEEVHYEEINYAPDSEFWELSDEIHSVDMNVIFRLENGQLLQIKWDHEFECYGIGFESLPQLVKREGFKTVNVSDHSNWRPFIGKTISEIVVYWDISEGLVTTFCGDKIIKRANEVMKLPQTWELKFEHEKVWISALEIREDKRVVFWTDHLSIVFTNREQEKYQLIEKANKQYSVCHLA